MLYAFQDVLSITRGQFHQPRELPLRRVCAGHDPRRPSSGQLILGSRQPPQRLERETSPNVAHDA